MSHYDDLPDCQNNFLSSVQEIEKERKLLIKLYNNQQTTITSCTGKNYTVQKKCQYHETASFIEKQSHELHADSSRAVAGYYHDATNHTRGKLERTRQVLFNSGRLYTRATFFAISSR